MAASTVSMRWCIQVNLVCKTDQSTVGRNLDLGNNEKLYEMASLTKHPTPHIEAHTGVENRRASPMEISGKTFEDSYGRRSKLVGRGYHTAAALPSFLGPLLHQIIPGTQCIVR
jgi:hypothetical protein